MSDVNPEIQAAIDMATDHAVEKVFAILGVDINKPESVEAFREDLRFGRALRKAKEKGLLAVAATVGTAIAFAVFQGIVTAVTTGK